MWVVIRIGIFTAAFCAGLLIRGNEGAGIARLDEPNGAFLIVSCNEGDMLVTPLVEGASVQLECLRSRMWVLRDAPGGWKRFTGDGEEAGSF